MWSSSGSGGNCQLACTAVKAAVQSALASSQVCPASRAVITPDLELMDQAGRTDCREYPHARSGHQGWPRPAGDLLHPMTLINGVRGPRSRRDTLPFRSSRHCRRPIQARSTPAGS
jgi:hypothetical protein